MTKGKSEVESLDINEFIGGNINEESLYAMILILFEQVEHGDNDENSKIRWNHKGLEREFWNYLLDNKKSWYMGIWNK